MSTRGNAKESDKKSHGDEWLNPRHLQQYELFHGIEATGLNLIP